MARYLAIEIEPSGLAAAAGTIRGHALSLERVCVRPDWGGTLSASSAEPLGRSVQELLKEAGIKPAPVLLNVSRDRLILKEVTHPPTAPAEEPQVVRFQAIKELSDAPDDVVMDYLPLGVSNDLGERKALAVFLRKDYVAAAKQLCETAGLKLAGITARPFALAASLRRAIATDQVHPPTDPLAAVGLVNLTPNGGDFVVFRGDRLLFMRSIPGHAVRNDNALLAELKRNLTVYNTQNPSAPLEAIYIPESASAGVGTWASFLGQELSLPVHGYDPLTGSPLADTVPDAVKNLTASPLGTLALKAENDTLPVNFVSPRQPRAERRKINPRIIIGLAAALLIGGLLVTLAWIELNKAEAALREKAELSSTLDLQLQRLEPDSKRYAAAEEFRQREVVWLDEMYDLTTRIPNVDKATIMEIDGNALPPPKKEVTRTPILAKAGPMATTPASGRLPSNVTPAPKKELPVASLRIVVRASNPDDPQRISDDFSKDDKFYVGVTKSKPNSQTDSRSDPTYTINTMVLHRGPDKYTRQLKATMPKLESAPPPAFDGFGGGFGDLGGFNSP